MKIVHVSLLALWGVKNYNLNLSQDFNFIIGPNGSGKTTLLNLISSIFKLDIDIINKIDFRECKISLIDEKSNSHSISVLKGEDVLGDNVINFLIETNGSTICSDFFNCRGLDKDDVDSPRNRMLIRKAINNSSDELNSFLNDKIKLAWLPIERSKFIFNERDYRANSLIDLKLNDISNRFTKYMANINKVIADKINLFQKNIFMSAVDLSYFEKSTKGKITVDIDREKNLLIEAFKEVGIEDHEYNKNVNKMFDSINDIKNKQGKIKKAGKKYQYSLHDVVHIFNLWKTHFLVESFNSYKESKNIIRHDLELFISILNELFENRKEFFVSNTNELCVYSSNDSEVKLTDLSSGEKQLIIILAESLLQEGNDFIYVIDEPELSLHVYWQEKLVDSINKINEKSQIIFATHSPDIVSYRTNNIVQMDEI